jgi:hypothetical protein
MLSKIDHIEKRYLIFAATLVTALGVAMPRVLADSSSNLHLSGTLDIEQTRVAFLVSGSGGGGTLHYAGRNYPFTIGGLGVGGIGVTKLEAVGQVYNMKGVSEFSGMYSAVRTGYALADKGNGKLWLQNSNGVVIKLQGKSEGVGLSLGADAVRIALK